MDTEKQQLIDTWLIYGAEALDLTPTQYASAVQKYQAVGRWLSHSESALTLMNPQIYPQGSLAIGTATKPVGRDEFDLDIVCQLVVNNGIAPVSLKRLVGERLKEHAVYRDRLLEKNRCWRIVYAGEFHMDILPARLDPRFPPGSTALLVPDRELAGWKETDPKGYAGWFIERSNQFLTLDEATRAAIEPLPQDPNQAPRSPLQRAVQILKRHRDLCMGDDDDAPISIIITTLAAMAYQGQRSVYATLADVLRAMPGLIEMDADGHPLVRNPVNPLENFADKWADNPRKQHCFQDWVQRAITDLSRLEVAALPLVTGRLEPFVGERAAKAAVKRYGEDIQAARPAGLRVSAATGALGSTASAALAIPPNTFFGRTSR